MSGKMLHVVLFNLDPAKVAAEFPGNSLYESIAGLKDQVPGILEIGIYEKNANPWEGYVDCSQGFTHSVVSKHIDVEALHVFAVHPAHKVVQTRVYDCMASPLLRFDMNIPDSA